MAQGLHSKSDSKRASQPLASQVSAPDVYKSLDTDLMQSSGVVLVARAARAALEAAARDAREDGEKQKHEATCRE